MARQADTRQIAKLAQVQHVREAASKASLEEARDTESAASEAHRKAESDAVGAMDDWLECLATPRFEPERAGDFAARLITREAALQEATALHEDARERHLSRQSDWRLSAARVKLANTMLKAARRAAGRSREEQRLTHLAERITYSWTRP